MSENTVFKEYHEDGIKLFNKTMNMKQVVNDLRDPKHRILNEVRLSSSSEVKAKQAASHLGRQEDSHRTL